MMRDVCCRPEEQGPVRFVGLKGMSEWQQRKGHLGQLGFAPIVHASRQVRGCDAVETSLKMLLHYGRMASLPDTMQGLLTYGIRRVRAWLTLIALSLRAVVECKLEGG
jgi:hypothetical protein